MSYYKFYLQNRYKHVANEKLLQQNESTKKNYYRYLKIALLVILSTPCLQFIYHEVHLEGIILNYYENSSFLFWKKHVMVFNVISIVSTLFLWWGFYFISNNYRLEDTQKRIKLFNKNLITLFFFYLLNLSINLIAIVLNDLVNPDFNWLNLFTLRIMFVFITSVMFSTYIFVIILIFAGTFYFIRVDIGKVKTKDAEGIKQFIYIYWTHFLKSLIINQPTFLIGFILLTLLTSISFVVRGGEIVFFRRHFIESVAFYSFWVTSVNLTIGPLVNGIRNLNLIYNQYSLHIIRTSIIPKLKNHILIIGVRNLGKQIIRNCFVDIHPEGYGIESLCEEGDEKHSEPVDDLSDYDIIIDKDLNIQAISRRITVIDKDSSLFIEKYKDLGEISIATYQPWSDDTIHLVLLGICGDAKNEYVLNALSANKAQIIINATPISELSLFLSMKYPEQKQILNVNDSYTFDTLITATYDRALYLIDTQSIEGVTISQLIFHWAYTNIRNNFTKKDVQLVAKDNLLIELLQIIGIEEIQERFKNQKKSSLIKYGIARNGNGRILLVGSGSYLFHIIKSLIMTMQFEMGLNYEMIRDILQNKIFLMVDDEKIEEEIIEENGVTYWKFYPVRNYYTSLESYYKLRTFIGSIQNFERFVEVLSQSFNDSLLNTNKTFMLLPELMVLINAKTYTSVDMFISATTAIEVLNNSLGGREKYNPHIIVYSNRADKYFLVEQFKKFFTFNLERNEKIGYPTQLQKESRITKDWVSANQFSSMMRTLLEKNIQKNQKYFIDDYIAEVTFSVKDFPGSIANLSATMVNRKIIYNKTYDEVKVPNFINYYSSEEVRYKDTFLFKGFAKLDRRPQISNVKNIINYCFINCNEKHRKTIFEILCQNYNFNESENSVDTMNNKLFDSGMFSHYPVSSILRHPDKYYDIAKRRPRFWHSSNIFNDELKSIKDVSNIQDSNDLIMSFNVSDFTIWAEGEEKAGSLAEVLAEIILCKTEKKEKINSAKYLDIEPIIFYSNNRPSIRMQKKGTNIKNHVDHDAGIGIAQDSFYIKLRSKEVETSSFNGLIRAVKVKLSSEIRKENLDWSIYLCSLKDHLNEKCNKAFSYSLYLIKKTFTEGFELEGIEGLSEVSFYFKVETPLNKIENKLNISPLPEFRIDRQRATDHLRRELPNLSLVDLNKYYKYAKGQMQSYEFVLIRYDIIKRAIEDTNLGLKFTNNLNKIYFIDDL